MPLSEVRQNRFADDLRTAATALVRQPSVPLFSVGLYLVPLLVPSPNNDRALLTLAWCVPFFLWLAFSFGWFGVERIFFLRQLRNQPITLRQLVGLARAFVGRFFRLGMLTSIWIAPFLAVSIAIQKSHPGWSRVSTALCFILLDFSLTFVTPALAFTTRSARNAVRIGFDMIRETWPRCAIYVLCPPLALNILNFQNSSPIERGVLTVLIVLTALLAKGTIVAFYVREKGVVSDDGATFSTT